MEKFLRYALEEGVEADISRNSGVDIEKDVQV